MFKLKSPGVLAFVVIFYSNFEKGESNNATMLDFRIGNDQARKSKNSSENHYSIECSDHEEVARFREHKCGHFDYYNIMPEIHIQNEINSTVVINKCCGWDYYFNVDNFACTRLGLNSTKPDFLVTKTKNETTYLFIESIPDCGNQSVLSFRSTPRVSVGLAGAVIDEGKVFPKYCIDGNPSRPLEVMVLSCNDPASFCSVRTCFRKCCPLGHSYEFPGRKCQKSKEPFKTTFYNLSTLSSVDPLELSEYGLYLGDACGIKGKYLLERDSGEVSYIGLDGTLFVPGFEKQNFSESEFCVEFVKVGNRSALESFLCFSKTGNHFENSQLQFFLLSLAFIISSMFLMLTFLIYLFSPKCQNLYGKTLMCYIACLFSAYLCLAVIELKSREIDKSVCINLGYSLLFSFLAAFFWLNVMSFDIWKTFRLDRNAERSKANKRNLQFLWYSLYAWGFPSAITGACAYVNQVHSFPYGVIRPDIGEENCWFSKKRRGIYVFFIAPISLVITFNIIFYVQTAWKIWKVKSDVKKMKIQKKKFSRNKDQFVVNGKLFIVMGITWSLEIISFFAPHPIWYVTDAANALHGVFIFAVFGLKKKVIHKLSLQMRAPLKRKKQLTTASTENTSAIKNFQDLNTKANISPNGTSLVFTLSGLKSKNFSNEIACRSSVMANPPHPFVLE